MSDNLSPTQRVIAEASKPVEITDSLGRTLRVRKLTALDQLKLYRAIGADHSANQQVFWMSAAAAACSQIDELPLRFPTRESHIDDAMAKLGDEGIAAIMIHQAEQVRAITDAAEAAANGEGASVADPLPPSA